MSRTCTCSSGWRSSAAAKCKWLPTTPELNVLAFRVSNTTKNREDERSKPDSHRHAYRHRAFRRADRGCRHFRRRRGLSPDDAMSGDELCCPGNPEHLWRHLEHASLSGYPLRQRPAYVRLPLQALDLGADRKCCRDSQI